MSGMNTVAQSVRLLHGLGYQYGRYGQSKRALVLLLIAARLAPDDAAVLRTLAHVLLLDGAPRRAAAVLERLAGLEGAEHPALDLLRSRVLRECGRKDEARDAFRRYVARRGPVRR
jgi:type III secretion protein Y